MASEIPSTFEQTLQTSTAWIREIRGALDECDEHQAYHALAATLQTLRDRLPIAEAVQFGAQLPVLIRGLYYEGWRPSETPVKLRSRADFVTRVGERYHTAPLPSLDAAVAAVLATVARRVSPGESRSLIRVLPEELRGLWPAPLVAEVAREGEDEDAATGRRGDGPGDSELPYLV